MRDPYEVLGVRRGAPFKEIRAAFLNKMRLYHPDVNGGVGNPQAFVEAYDAFQRIVYANKDARAQRISACQHCRGRGTCWCQGCQMVIVFKAIFFAGQCARCA